MAGVLPLVVPFVPPTPTTASEMLYGGGGEPNISTMANNLWTSHFKILTASRNSLLHDINQGLNHSRNIKPVTLYSRWKDAGGYLVFEIIFIVNKKIFVTFFWLHTQCTSWTSKLCLFTSSLRSSLCILTCNPTKHRYTVHSSYTVLFESESFVCSYEILNLKDYAIILQKWSVKATDLSSKSIELKIPHIMLRSCSQF